MSFMQMILSDLIANIVDGIDKARAWASSFSKQLMFLTPKRKTKPKFTAMQSFNGFQLNTCNYSLVFNESLNLIFFFYNFRLETFVCVRNFYWEMQMKNEFVSIGHTNEKCLLLSLNMIWNFVVWLIWEQTNRVRKIIIICEWK